MARLDQSTWHRVDPDSLPVEVLKMTFSVSSVRIQECGPVSFWEHVGLKEASMPTYGQITAG